LLIADPSDTLGRAPGPAIDFLECQLSRAARRGIAAVGVSRALFELFGFEASAGVPAAALTRLAESGEPPSGHWMRADPVRLDVGSQLVLKQHGGFGMTKGELDDVADSLASYFQERGERFLAPDPERWYLHREHAFDVHSTPPDEPGPGDLSENLPEGETATQWRRVMDETQILLHNHPVSARRRDAGLASPNSLWFWGEGPLPSPRPARFSQVLGGEPLAEGLKRLCGTAPSGATLLVARGECPDLWHHWIEASRRVRTRHVMLPQWGLAFRCGRLDAARFWRPRRPLSRLLSGMGNGP